MNHIEVNDDLVKALLENAAWDKAGAPLKLDEEKKTSEKVEEANMFGNEDSEEKETVSENSEEHTCPMCDSILEEALSDEKIMECVNNICDVLDELNEDASEEDEEDED